MKNLSLIIIGIVIVFITSLFSKDIEVIEIQPANSVIEIDYQIARNKYLRTSQEVNILKSEVKKEIDSIKTKM